MSKKKPKSVFFEYCDIQGSALDYAFIASITPDDSGIDLASEVAKAKGDRNYHELVITVNGVKVCAKTFLDRYKACCETLARREIRTRLKQQIDDVLDPFDDDSDEVSRGASYD